MKTKEISEKVESTPSERVKKSWLNRPEKIKDDTYWKCMECGYTNHRRSSVGRHYVVKHGKKKVVHNKFPDILVYNIRRFN